MPKNHHKKLRHKTSSTIQQDATDLAHLIYDLYKEQVGSDIIDSGQNNAKTIQTN